MQYKTAYIATTDNGLAEELETCNLPGVEVLTRLTGAVSAEQVFQFIIHLSSAVAVGVFARWIYEKIINRDPKKTTINSQQIINNLTQITIIINGDIQKKEE